jgi:hypothetical protein
MSLYYDKQGNPIDDTIEWGNLRSDEEYSRIGSTVEGDYWVSTVWLGIDHSFLGGPPIIFETMVFKGNADSFDPTDRYMERYSTLHEAQSGHARICNMVREGKLND